MMKRKIKYLQLMQLHLHRLFIYFLLALLIKKQQVSYGRKRGRERENGGWRVERGEGEDRRR
jgi:hypothetical protein